MKQNPIRLDKLLSSLGYCSRREVRKLLSRGYVSVEGLDKLKPDTKVLPEHVRVEDEPLDPLPGLVVVLHKPVGFVCTTDDTGDSVFELLPERFAFRNPVLAPIGRLDKDTSGLLLLTDDGTLNHRLTSPRHAVEKVYEVTLAHPFQGHEQASLASGTLMLRSEEKPLLPASLEVTGENTGIVRVTEGRYHLVRRAFAALGNRVVALHRPQIGGLALGELPEGEWRLLTPEERPLLDSSS